MMILQGEENSNDESEEDDEAEEEVPTGNRVIELNFALGDFDETPIAKLEEAAGDHTERMEDDN